MKNKIYNILIIVFIIAILANIAYIFSNSLQKSSESNEKSGQISTQIQEVVDPEEKIEKKVFHKFIRKSAHVTEFALLGVWVAGLMLTVSRKYGRKLISESLLFLLLVASTDEFIQEFNDRSSKVSDVFIDFSGAIVGFLLIIGIVLLIIYLKRKQKYGV